MTVGGGKTAELGKRLLEAGGRERTRHFRLPEESPFTAEQRPRTKLLFGGLTVAHEVLIEGFLEGMGYRTERLPTPDLRAFRVGREYGNNGQCNPTYFTVGNLIRYLQKLQDSGLSRQEILEGYVFLTAGSCGPCRFGMYESEYRRALRNAGFEGFRVLLFQQQGGLTQNGVEAGLRLDLDFFLALITALAMGDLLNQAGYQIRPYEVEAGATDRALERCASLLRATMKSRRPWSLGASRVRFLRRTPRLARRVEAVGKFFDQFTSRHYTEALRNCHGILAQVAVDRTRVKPIVKITGEFWAQTTEGDGNFRMFEFLGAEGAEILIEPVTTWIFYVLWQIKQGYKDRLGLRGHRNPLRYLLRLTRLSAAEVLLAREYGRLRKALGATSRALVNQLHLERLGHPHYNSRIQGGEGHLEVAKNIYYTSAKLCHMVLSLKPFGCMPSTQSDGVQSAVVEKFPDMIFLPIETSGEGEISALSRVQMALAEARQKAKEEFREALQKVGRSLTEIREYAKSHPALRSALYQVPRDRRYAGTAAQFVTHVARLMNGGS